MGQVSLKVLRLTTCAIIALAVLSAPSFVTEAHAVGGGTNIHRP